MSFESEQLPAFLEHIAKDEALEIERLRAEYEAEARAVRVEARRESKRFHRRVVDEARTRIQTDHQRKLSRARNEFRRRRWQALAELREQAHARIRSGLLERWRDPDGQLAWCRFWLNTCDRLAGDGAIGIRVSADANPETLAWLRESLDRRGVSATLDVDEAMDAGIVIAIAQRSLDGLLQTQVEPMLDAMSRELAGWVHRGDDDSEVGI